MASENETIADIVAVMRHDAELCYDIWLNDPNNNSQSESICEILNGYADRIEAAWKRERESLFTKQSENVNSGSAVYTGENNGGNAAAMREALENAHSLICEGIETEVDDEIEHPFHLELACEVIQRALSAPPRNCDIYPTNEDAWRSYQLSHAKNADAYVEATVPDFIDWLFAPAEEGADA